MNSLGYLYYFLGLIASKDMTAILSLAVVEKYRAAYVSQESFAIHLPNKDVMLSSRGKLHIAD